MRVRAGQGWAVAILDTGVDKNHEFLPAKSFSRLVMERTTRRTAEAVFVPAAVTATTATNSGLPWMASDSCDHGTHVAGIAAGRNGDGNIDGVARDAKIIAIKIFSASRTATARPIPCLRTFNSDIIKKVGARLCFAKHLQYRRRKYESRRRTVFFSLRC